MRINTFAAGKTPKYLVVSKEWCLISQKILMNMEDNPTMKNLIIHTGALDNVKQTPEILKDYSIQLLNKVQGLSIKVFLSEPLPTVRGGEERFSRLVMINK
ncbi:hypothetical protein AMECASPLE_033900 [Ameca splendens]|uniref:Uncharacterized protein n=1 Tax=Ameca splendens TaxID=208324 RepID=A0ABV0YIG1_9TELE